MMIAIDIGNTNSKFVFFNALGVIVNKYTIETSHFQSPESWRKYFTLLIQKNPNFAKAQLKISCVSWKVFLVLRVIFDEDLEENFNLDTPFDAELLNFSKKVPVVREEDIPLDCSHTENLVGTDRVLAAYAAYQKYHRSTVVVSLGSATAIDLVTDEGVFYAGLICPGLESSYQGLLHQVPHLPSMDFLSKDHNSALNQDVLGSLSSGLFLAHALMVEAVYIKQKAILNKEAELLLTGGNALAISPYIANPHSFEDDMVAYGLFALSKNNS
ncbi:MAG: type III pantothenate kinase [Brevinema sp.]